MKQTAVEWLEDQIKTSKYSYKVMEDINSRGTVAQPNIFEQAKQMEKEQIIAFGKKCYHPLTERKHTSDVHFECTICGDNNY